MMKSAMDSKCVLYKIIVTRRSRVARGGSLVLQDSIGSHGVLPTFILLPGLVDNEYTRTSGRPVRMYVLFVPCKG